MANETKTANAIKTNAVAKIDWNALDGTKILRNSNNNTNGTPVKYDFTAYPYCEMIAEGKDPDYVRKQIRKHNFSVSDFKKWKNDPENDTYINDFLDRCKTYSANKSIQGGKDFALSLISQAKSPEKKDEKARYFVNNALSKI